MTHSNPNATRDAAYTAARNARDTTLAALAARAAALDEHNAARVAADAAHDAALDAALVAADAAYVATRDAAYAAADAARYAALDAAHDAYLATLAAYRATLAAE